METIVSYSITTLHNVLLDSNEKVKTQLRKMGAIHQMIPLLAINQNVKFLSILVDCLQILTYSNNEAKQLVLELNGTQALVNLLLNASHYQKLLLNLTRLLKVLSTCNANKQALVGFNAIQALSMHLKPPSTSAETPSNKTTNDILNNLLITIRNLSDSATRMNGLEGLVQATIQIMSATNDFSVCTIAAGILSNLTCNNESNKKTAVKSNAIPILLRIIQSNLVVHNKQIFNLVEPSICALRHITNRHADMLLAHEQVRSINGLNVISQFMCSQPRSWPCIKATLGLVRNFCSNQLNAQQIRANGVIEKLMQILYDAYTEIQNRTNNGMSVTNLNNVVVKVDDVNLMDIVDACSAALLVLAKEYQNQVLMKDLECISFFIHMFFSPLPVVQKAAVCLLAEISASKECSEVIEQFPGLNQFIQANFCNQFGALKTLAEVSTNSNPHATVILQHVTTLMQRIQEHKSQRAYAQQQQQQQRNTFQPFPQQQVGAQPQPAPQQDQFGMYYGQANMQYQGQQQYPVNPNQFF
jgi:hypothetical protein